MGGGWWEAGWSVGLARSGVPHAAERPRNARGCVLWWFKWCLGEVRRSPRAALRLEQSWSPAPFQNTCDEDVDF